MALGDDLLIPFTKIVLLRDIDTDKRSAFDL